MCPLHAPTFAGLVTVNFRQNLLPDVSAWADAACKGTLEDLEFRDNQLKEVCRLGKPFSVCAERLRPWGMLEWISAWLGCA